jgi:hypothetical protein
VASCGQVGRERPADVGPLGGANAQRLGSQLYFEILSKPPSLGKSRTWLKS